MSAGPLSWKRPNAKFYGSYQALESGTAIEAAVDFTGGIPEYIDISEIGRDGIETREQEIFLNLERASQRNAFLSCSMSVGTMMLIHFHQLL